MSHSEQSEGSRRTYQSIVYIHRASKILGGNIKGNIWLTQPIYRSYNNKESPS